MLRQLFTLLAFLTGLTTVVAPAQAMETGVQAVQMTQDASSCQSQVGVPAAQAPDVRRVQIVPQEKICRRPVITIRVPTVMLKVDRARE